MFKIIFSKTLILVDASCNKIIDPFCNFLVAFSIISSSVSAAQSCESSDYKIVLIPLKFLIGSPLIVPLVFNSSSIDIKLSVIIPKGAYNILLPKGMNLKFQMIF